MRDNKIARAAKAIECQGPSIDRSLAQVWSATEPFVHALRSWSARTHTRLRTAHGHGHTRIMRVFCGRRAFDGTTHVVFDLCIVRHAVRRAISGDVSDRAL